MQTKKYQYENLSKEDLAKLVADIKRQYRPQTGEIEKAQQTSTLLSNTDQASGLKSEEKTHGVDNIVEMGLDQKGLATQIDELKKDMKNYFNEGPKLESK